MIDPALLTYRTEIIRCELLTTEDVSQGILGRILAGRLDASLGRNVRGGGRVTLTLSRDVDWLDARLKFTRGIRLPDGSELMYPIGVYRTLVGDEDWSAEGATVECTLVDKTSVLDELVMDRTYTLPVGYPVLQAVRELLLEAKEFRYIIVDSTASLAVPMTWDVGTTFLRIINDLLVDVLGYFGIWCDGDGYFRVEPYTAPRDRPVAFHFRNDTRSVVTPEFKLLQEPFKVPNKVVGTSRVEGEEPQLISIATNEDPTSEFSYQNRGERWYTETMPDLDVADQQALDEQVARRLTQATAMAQGVDFTHGWLPLDLNDVIGWTNTRAGVDMYATLMGWEMELVAGSLVSSKASKVVTV